jgi:hypothetical protein
VRGSVLGAVIQNGQVTEPLFIQSGIQPVTERGEKPIIIQSDGCYNSIQW